MRTFSNDLRKQKDRLAAASPKPNRIFGSGGCTLGDLEVASDSIEHSDLSLLDRRDGIVDGKRSLFIQRLGIIRSTFNAQIVLPLGYFRLQIVHVSGDFRFQSIPLRGGRIGSGLDVLVYLLDRFLGSSLCLRNARNDLIMRFLFCAAAAASSIFLARADKLASCSGKWLTHSTSPCVKTHLSGHSRGHMRVPTAPAPNANNSEFFFSCNLPMALVLLLVWNGNFGRSPILWTRSGKTLLTHNINLGRRTLSAMEIEKLIASLKCLFDFHVSRADAFTRHLRRRLPLMVCYRHAEMIVRDRLELWQHSVDKTIKRC